MLIRAEIENERIAVFAFNESAFDTPTEADLVDALCEKTGRVKYHAAFGNAQRFNRTALRDR